MDSLTCGGVLETQIALCCCPALGESCPLAKFTVLLLLYLLQLLSQSDIKMLESFCLSSVVEEFIFCLLITKLSFCSHQENSVAVGCGFTAEWESNPYGSLT